MALSVVGVPMVVLTLSAGAVGDRWSCWLCRSHCPLPIQKSTPVVLPVSTGLVPAACRSFSRSVGMSPLTSLLVSSVLLVALVRVVETHACDSYCR
jgi:hypothetical protein